MKKRFAYFLAVGMTALTLAMTGGCCHHRMHGNSGCNCQQACGRANCNQAAPGNQAGCNTVSKPCCPQAQGEAQKAVQPK